MKEDEFRKRIVFYIGLFTNSIFIIALAYLMNVILNYLI